MTENVWKPNKRLNSYTAKKTQTADSSQTRLRKWCHQQPKQLRYQTLQNGWQFFPLIPMQNIRRLHGKHLSRVFTAVAHLCGFHPPTGIAIWTRASYGPVDSVFSTSSLVRWESGRWRIRSKGFELWESRLDRLFSFYKNEVLEDLTTPSGRAQTAFWQLVPPGRSGSYSFGSTAERSTSRWADVTSGALTLSPACRRLRQQRAGLGAPGLKSCGSEHCRLRRCLRPPASGSRRGRARVGGRADARGPAPGRSAPHRPLPSVPRPGPAPLRSLETSASAARLVARGELRTAGVRPWRSPGGSNSSRANRRFPLSLGSGAFLPRLRSSPLSQRGFGLGLLHVSNPWRNVFFLLNRPFGTLELVFLFPHHVSLLWFLFPLSVLGESFRFLSILRPIPNLHFTGKLGSNWRSRGDFELVI